MKNQPMIVACLKTVLIQRYSANTVVKKIPQTKIAPSFATPTILKFKNITKMKKMSKTAK